MGVESWAIVVVTALFAVFIWLSGLQFGLALARLFPWLSPALRARRLQSAYWELGSLFALLGCAGFVLFFGNAVSAAVSAAMPCLAVALAALLTRAGLTMYASWRKVSPGLSYVNYWLMLASVLVPLSVGAAGIHLVTGLPLWRTSEGWVLGIGLCCGVAAVSLSFLYFLSQRQTSRKLIIGGRTANILLAGSTALLLPWVLYCTGSHVLGLGYSYLAVIAAALVLWQAVSLAARKEWRMWWYISFMALAGPVLVAVANFPYLFFPNWTLHEAAGFLAYGPLLLVALSVVGLVVFAGLICLARSLAALKK